MKYIYFLINYEGKKKRHHYLYFSSLIDNQPWLYYTFSVAIELNQIINENINDDNISLSFCTFDGISLISKSIIRSIYLIKGLLLNR